MFADLWDVQRRRQQGFAYIFAHFCIDPVDKILPPPVEGVPDLQCVKTVGGSGEGKHRVGVEIVVIGESEDLVCGILHRKDGLEVAGDTVTDKGIELSAQKFKVTDFSLFETEFEMIHLSGFDLSVDHTGECEFHRLSFQRGHLVVLFPELRVFPHIEEQRIGAPALSAAPCEDPQFPGTGGGIFVDLQSQDDLLTDGGTCLQTVGALKDPFTRQ